MSFSECSSNLSADSEYYNSDESCDYSGCSHHYHCTKCSKPRDIPESRDAAIHRVIDRLNLVNHKRDQLTSMNSEQLTTEFSKRFKIKATFVSDQDKINQLLWTFISENEPSTEYRLSRKFYKYAVNRWRCDKLIEPDMEDIYIEMINNKQLYIRDFARYNAKIMIALHNETEPVEHKLDMLTKMTDLLDNIVAEPTRNHYISAIKTCTDHLNV